MRSYQSEVMSFSQNGKCEEEKHSRGNLGPVENDERLARIVKTPQHIVQKDTGSVKKGTFKLGLFSQTDITTKGVSVTRVNKVEPDWFSKYAKEVATEKGNLFHGTCEAQTVDIRSILDSSGERAFCVMEDPADAIASIPENSAHAIIIASKEIESDKAEVIKLQLALHEVFSKSVIVSGET